MTTEDSAFLDPADLRIGHYVVLDVGWMKHPFPSGSFKISKPEHLDIIRGLGLAQVRIVPSRSELEQDGNQVVDPLDRIPAPRAPSAEALLAAQREQQLRRQRAEQVSAQQNSLLACERRFGESVRAYRKTLEVVHSQPKAAAEHSMSTVKGLVGEMLADGESAIRLLTEAAGDKASMHTINVTVVSLLLGKAMGLGQHELVDLGMAAFLHDIGKAELPDRVRWMEDNFSAAEFKLYQEHVAQSVLLCKLMGQSSAVLASVAQHHELADGSGFPLKLKAGSMTPGARILALVNRYDNLCNPSRPSTALTPHESLSMIFAQLKSRFDTVALSAFIRMMGVYPPGSVVQLIDDRHAMVVSVNSARPLKPRVIVHEPGVPKHEALIMDLELHPHIGIRKSVRPSMLPSAAMDYLGPRQKVAYYFEPSAPAKASELTMA